MALCLTPGHLHDLQGADVLLPHLEGRFGALLADRAYDAQERVVDVLERLAVKPVIPSKINRTHARKHDAALYAARHLIENFFARLKTYRAIATRYDKRACAFLGAIHLAAAIITIN